VITARVVDTRRLSTLAHEYEREVVRFFHDLTGNEVPIVERIRQEAAKIPFQEISVDPEGNLLARIGSGKHVILMEAHASATGAAGMAAMIYAGKLIDELGMYDDFTLWIAGSAQKERHHTPNKSRTRPGCVMFAEPTNLCIRMREAESRPLARAAIATYETLFELPPIVSPSRSSMEPMDVPAIEFGPGVPLHHLLKAAQFYAAFPMIFAETLKRR
jgi:hypothetical protein